MLIALAIAAAILVTIVFTAMALGSVLSSGAKRLTRSDRT